MAVVPIAKVREEWIRKISEADVSFDFSVHPKNHLEEPCAQDVWVCSNLFVKHGE
jgi:hypothetical protein